MPELRQLSPVPCAVNVLPSKSDHIVQSVQALRGTEAFTHNIVTTISALWYKKHDLVQTEVDTSLAGNVAKQYFSLDSGVIVSKTRKERN